MTEISIYTDQIGSGTSELFSSPDRNSATIVLAPGHKQPRHGGCRADLSFSKEHFPQLSGEAFASDDIVVRSFPNAVVFSDYGVVRDANGHFVTETLGALRFLNPHISNVSDVELYARSPDVLARGNYVYATHGNYYVFSHMLFETMCTAYLLRSLFSIGLVSLMIPSCSQSWLDPLLDSLEIPRCARYPLTHSRVQAGNLILSSTCSVWNTYRPNIVMKDMAKYFVDKWGSKDGKRTRLYLTREGSSNTSKREYVQDADLSELLKDLGFITLNPATLPFEEQVRIFSTADIVVSAHGSALANLIFAPRGCKVVDILHDSWANAGGYFTTNLTNLFEQEYVYLIAESLNVEGGLSISLDPKLVYERVKRFLKE